MVFEDIRSGDYTGINNDYSLCRFLRRVSDMVAWMHLVGRVDRVILS